jgi:hypothetical protein
MRQAKCGAAGNGLSTTINYLRRTTSGATGCGRSRHRGSLMCPFTTSASHSPCFVHAFFASKLNSTAEAQGLIAQCVFLGPELARRVDICSVSLHICRVVHLLLRQRRGAVGYGLGISIK